MITLDVAPKWPYSLLNHSVHALIPQGSLNFGGTKQCKCIVILVGFPLIVYRCLVGFAPLQG